MTADRVFYGVRLEPLYGADALILSGSLPPRVHQLDGSSDTYLTWKTGNGCTHRYAASINENGALSIWETRSLPGSDDVTTLLVTYAPGLWVKVEGDLVELS